jgi:hypothetical protein
MAMQRAQRIVGAQHAAPYRHVCHPEPSEGSEFKMTDQRHGDLFDKVAEVH